MCHLELMPWSLLVAKTCLLQTMEDVKRERKISAERADFIVVTEFSEREGPICPLTVPSELPQEWNFNKSAFALKVLGSEFRKKKSIGFFT